MKNPFTKLGNKFTMTIDKVRQTIFRQRQKDAGTKKETHRGKGGGSSAVVSKVTNEAGLHSNYPKRSRYRSKESRDTLRRAKARRIKNKMAARSRRINRIKRQNGKAA